MTTELTVNPADNMACVDSEFCQATHRFANLNAAQISSSTSDEQAREHLLGQMASAYEHLKATIRLDDLPPYFRTPKEREQYLAYLRNLRVDLEPDDGFYYVDNTQGTIKIGVHVLELIRKKFTHEQVEMFIQLMMLHECIHIQQGLLSSNWRGITNASVVLEDMDYICDSISIATAIAWDARLNGFSRELAAKWGDFQITQLGMFTQASDNEVVMENLDEGFLRRLLIWNFQAVRIGSAHSVQEVFRLLEKKVSVEIQGLVGELNDEFYKVVRKALPDAEFFVSHGGNLYRSPSRKDAFDVPSIIDSVMRYEWGTVRKKMAFFAELYADVFLIPPPVSPHAG